MTAALWKTGTVNAFSTTLNGGITDTDATIALTTTTGLQYPGVIVIDRVDANNTSTPTTREYISFTGISGNSITGCDRSGLGGSTAQSHSSGAKVEEVWSITHWNDFIDTFAVSHDSAGKIATSFISVVDQRVANSLNVSGASLTGSFPITPVWIVSGAVSLATTSVGPSVTMPQPGVWDFFSATLKTPASGASLVLDFNKNGTSIFQAGTRPFITGGGTFVSTASVNTKPFVSGDTFTLDIDAGAGLGTDLTFLGRAR